MAEILIIDTHNILTLAIADATSYLSDPPEGPVPSVQITPPGFDPVDVTLNLSGYRILTSASLGITIEGEDNLPLPDGIYHFRYLTDPINMVYAEKDMLRVDHLQEKFDMAFLRVDTLESDKSLKNQAKVTLSTIYFFLQGAIAAANQCALIESASLYNQAEQMLDSFLSSSCYGCSSVNYLI